MSDNEIYLFIKYIKSVLWRVAKYLSYIEDARYLKVNAEDQVLEAYKSTQSTLFAFALIFIFYFLFYFF